MKTLPFLFPLLLSGCLIRAFLSTPCAAQVGPPSLSASTDGPGEVAFQGATPDYNVVQSVGGSLTLGPGMTIRGGSGTIGNADLPLVNQGRIIAAGAESTIVVRGNPFTNTGTGMTQELNGGKVSINP